jgi:glucan phosphorylase
VALLALIVTHGLNSLSGLQLYRSARLRALASYRLTKSNQAMKNSLAVFVSAIALAMVMATLGNGLGTLSFCATISVGDVPLILTCHLL